MNLLVINSDSFRWDNLTLHGGESVHTPNLDALARVSCVFENAYTGSYPTLPNRAEVFTGKWRFPLTGWGPLEEESPTLAGMLSQAGIATHMEFDCPHIARDGMNYQRGFDSWNWVRGQENDNLAPAGLIKKMKVQGDPAKYRHSHVPMLKRHRANQIYRGRRHEQDFSMAAVARGALQAMEQLAGNPFFMWVDMFDPHEPHDPPRHWFERYLPGYDGVVYELPVYGRCPDYSPDELAAIKAAYLGETSMVDYWVGHLLEGLKALGLAEETIIVFTSDHGLAYGDQGYTGKNRVPLHGFIARIPLLISTPQMRTQGKGQRVAQLVQPIDFMPTFFNALGMEPPREVQPQGISLWPLVQGEQIETRPVAFSGMPNKRVSFNGPGGHLRVSSREWALIYPPMLEEGVRTAPMLFDLEADPAEQNDLLRDNPAEAKQLYEQYADFYMSINPEAKEPHAPPPEELV